jgi:transcriptional regulator with XRE-family HTH domain
MSASEKNTQTEEFLAWLDEALALRGWNDSELSRQAGIAHSVISHARRGRLPKWEASEAIAKALNVPPEAVFRRTGLLKDQPDELAAFEEWRSVLTQLPEKDRYELLRIAYLKLEMREEERSATHLERMGPRLQPAESG